MKQNSCVAYQQLHKCQTHRLSFAHSGLRILAQLDLTKILKPFAPPKNGAKTSYIKKKSIYPYSPKKVQFGSLIFLENIICRPENALAERALQNSQTIRTSQTGRLITFSSLCAQV